MFKFLYVTLFTFIAASTAHAIKCELAFYKFPEGQRQYRWEATTEEDARDRVLRDCETQERFENQDYCRNDLVYCSTPEFFCSLHFKEGMGVSNQAFDGRGSSREEAQKNASYQCKFEIGAAACQKGFFICEQTSVSDPY